VRTHDLAEMLGVGPAFTEELRRLGIISMEEAIRVERSWLGESRCDWLYERMRGIDSNAVLAHEPRKSVSSWRTFARDLEGDRTVEREILRLCVSATEALRTTDLRTRTVTVKIRDADFTTRQSDHTLPNPVETDQAVYAVTLPLLRELRQRRRTPGSTSVRTHQTGRTGTGGGPPA